MRIAYTDKLSLSLVNRQRLDVINDIIEEYLADNYILTLRQLYYQLVSRDIIPNDQKEYSKLSTLLKKGRMAGIVDWAAIEDRGRKPRIPYYAHDAKDALNDILQQFRIDRQQNQPNYIEVWVEKDALSNVFLRATEEYHINLMVNKGYSSCSAMHEAAKRFKNKMINQRSNGVILYFGDHDPSGIDMVRDIRDRMLEFQVPAFGEFEVVRPALTIDQVRQFNCPENPAKLSDPRASWYIQEYGHNSWELDALPPQELIDIITSSVLQYLDKDTYDAMLREEERERKIISDFIENL